VTERGVAEVRGKFTIAEELLPSVRERKKKRR
jgi:hypothetical protein